MTGRRAILFISQVYVPDPASVGQHLGDAAAELAGRGHRVVVLTSARGYEDPSVRYPARELRDGVEIVRLPLSSFGKRSLPLRIVGALLFLLQATIRGVLVRGLAGVVVSTSPPMAAMAALAVAAIRRVPIKYWVMDINPDQAVALGKVSPTGPAARAFEALNRRILRRAADVVTLDRLMAARLRDKLALGDRLSVIPPWPHEEHLEPVAPGENPWRREHGLEDRFVVMYSGNHSIASPLETLLEAARALEGEPRLAFVFVGGGLGKRAVAEAIAAGARNLVSLPYQPLASLRYSLSAADVHVVALGTGMAGVIHPCKIYGAMAVARPILYLGPVPSHAADLVDEQRLGRRVEHGDVAGMTAALRELAGAPPGELRAMGERGRALVRERYGKSILCGRLADVVERGLPSARPARDLAALVPEANG